jgi:hypothetical protein
MTETEIKELHSKMAKMAEELIEHGECVLILLTFMDEDKSGRYSRLLSQGRGNHYTREGIAFDYLYQMAQNNLGADQQSSSNQEEGYQP